MLSERGWAAWDGRVWGGEGIRGGGGGVTHVVQHLECV